MKILMLILKQVEYSETIIQQLAESGVRGGTILEGTGMANTLLDMEDLPVFGMLRHMLDSGEKERSKVMMFVLENSKVDEARGIIRGIIGDFNAPNTGIMFAIPITDVEGCGE